MIYIVKTSYSMDKKKEAYYYKYQSEKVILQTIKFNKIIFILRFFKLALKYILIFYGNNNE